MSKFGRLAIFLALYKYSLGSLKYILTRTRERLEELGNQEAIELVDEALEKHEIAVDADYQWNQTKREDRLKRQGTVKLDDKIDETLSSILNVVEGFTKMPDGSEQCDCAEEIIEEFFPEGVYPVTSMPFDDQHTHVDGLVRRMREDYPDHMEELNLTGLVDRLDELNEEFGRKLDPVGGVEYDEVQAAYTEAEDAFHRAFVNILDAYSDDMETLNYVLEPLMEQRELTRRYQKRRGSVPPVDPESGEPVEETDGQPPGQPDGESDGPSNDGGSGDGESDGESETDGETDETDGETNETDEEGENSES
jgi:hypothetical protein